NPFSGSDDDALVELEALLRDAVGIRMLADVPLGAFLSGGVDSSTVTALMQAQSSRPVRTFSIALEEQNYNEGDEAKRVAQHLGTDHVEFCVTAKEARAVIPSLAAMYDEPFADSSQIPTHLVARLARQHVTVGLSGDGGDELFGGYNRHAWVPRIWRLAKAFPQPVRALGAAGLRAFSPEQWNALFAAAQK